MNLYVSKSASSKANPVVVDDMISSGESMLDVAKQIKEHYKEFEIKRPTKGLIIEAFNLKDSVCLVTGAFNTGTCALLKNGEILKDEIRTMEVSNNVSNVAKIKENMANPRIKQDESLATFSYNLTKEDELVTFDKDARCVFNQIRGLIFSSYQRRNFCFNICSYQMNRWCL